MEVVPPGIGGGVDDGRVEMAMAGSEKVGHGHIRGMSMDMGHNPYLLPPGLQNSHESLLSLSRTMNGDNDKYRPAINVAAGDSASLHSFRSNPKWGQDDTSSYTGSTKLGQADDGQQGLLRNAQRMSRSSPSPEGIQDSSNNNAQAPKKPAIEKSTIQAPAPAKLSPKPTNYDHKDSSHLSVEVSDLRKSNNYLGAFIESGNLSLDPSDQPKIETAIEASTQESHEQIVSNKEYAHADSDYSDVSAPVLNPNSTKTPTTQVPRISLPFTDEASDYGDDQDRDIGLPEVQVSLDDKETQLTGGTPADRLRQSFYNNDNGIDTRRLTMGIRPLPPEDPSDNPEQRANRIRSFYKEYFDDSRPNHEGGHQHYGPEYYTDGVVYDPVTGDYSGGPSKPFAQPVGRRAMTPPPRAPPRFQGGPGHMATSSTAGSMQSGPRAFSSVSGRLPGRGPRKPAPPPSPLHVLPSPHLLKDDMSVLPIDYAPGKSYKDQREGRPETPKGGLRPYTPMRAHTPLVSSFDDLAVIPSP